jgi:hypothetical protein
MIDSVENDVEYLDNIGVSYALRYERQSALPGRVEAQPIDQSELPHEDSPFKSFGKSIRIPCWKFSDGEIVLKSSRPVAVDFKLSDYDHCAMNESLDIYAMGNSSIEAYKDFCLQLVHYYFHYTKAPNESLGPKAIQFKEIFSKYFTQIQP